MKKVLLFFLLIIINTCRADDWEVGISLNGFGYTTHINNTKDNITGDQQHENKNDSSINDNINNGKRS